MNNNLLLTRILQFLKKKTTYDQIEIFNKQLGEESENEKILKMLNEAANNPKEDLTKSDLDQAWEKISKRTGIKIKPIEKTEQRQIIYHKKYDNYRRSNAQKHIFGYVTVLSLLIVGLTIIYSISNNNIPDNTKPIKLKKLVVDYGSQTQITLKDGSKIKLDAGSKLQYPEIFSNEKREVFLTGEGFFEITPDSIRPFVVHAGSSIITVLGTKFTVGAWNNLDEVSVTVVEGVVSLKSSAIENSQEVILKKRQKGKILKNGKIYLDKKNDLKAEISWINHELILVNTPLDKVIDKLTRWYELRIKFPDPIYYNVKITGEFTNNNIDEVLKSIALVLDLKVNRTKNEVTFY